MFSKQANRYLKGLTMPLHFLRELGRAAQNLTALVGTEKVGFGIIASEPAYLSRRISHIPPTSYKLMVAGAQMRLSGDRN